MFERDIRRITRGGGCLIFFGLPFLFAGLLATILGPANGEWMTLLLGLPFTSVGAAFVFGRAGVILDRRHRTARTWWGLMVPFKSTLHSLDAASAVSIDHEIRRSKNSSYSVYPVRLEGGSAPLLVFEGRHYEESRRQAEGVAKFLSLGIRDRSSGAETFREAGKLDESIRDRARRLGLVAPQPRRPRDARSVERLSKNSAVVEIPPPGIASKHWGMLALCAVGSAVAFCWGLWPMLNGLRAQDSSVAGLFVAIFVVFFVLLPIGPVVFSMVRACRTSERVSITGYGIDIFRRGLFLSKTERYTSDEIEEIRLSGGVWVVTDRKIGRFGSGLPVPELNWLRDLSLRILTLPPGQSMV